MPSSASYWRQLLTVTGLQSLLLASLTAWAQAQMRPQQTAPSIIVSGNHADCVGVLSKDNRYGYWCWDPPEPLARPPQQYSSNIAYHAMGYDYVCVITLGGKLACWSIMEAIPGVLPRETEEAEVASVCITRAELKLRPIACVVMVGGGVSCFVIDSPNASTTSPWVGPDGREYLDYETLLDVPASLDNATHVACGMDYACAMDASGWVECWGGANAFNQADVPDEVATLGVLQVAAGEGVSCAVTKANALRCWGRLGDIELYADGAADVTLGMEIHARHGDGYLGAFICALTVNNFMRCFDDALAIIAMNDDFTRDIRQVALDSHSVCSLTLDDALFCSTFWPTPIVPPDLSTGAVQSVNGWDHMCVLNDDARVGCFGALDHGEGDVPQQLQGDIAQIAAGAEFTCAITTNTSVACWGQNQGGQLDLPPEFASNIRQIVGGMAHTCAVTYNDEVGCWGAEDPDENYNQTVVPPEAQTGVRAVSTTAYHTCAVSNEGRLSCWGYDGHGQASVPAQYAQDVSMVSAGWDHTCVVLTNGTVGCWGKNDFKQIDLPKPMRGGVLEVAAYMDHTCVLTASRNLFCYGNQGDYKTTTGGLTFDPRSYDGPRYSEQPVPDALRDKVASMSVGGMSCGINFDAEVACFSHPTAQFIPPEWRMLGEQPPPLATVSREATGSSRGRVLLASLLSGTGGVLAVLAFAAAVLLHMRKRLRGAAANAQWTSLVEMADGDSSAYGLRTVAAIDAAARAKAQGIQGLESEYHSARQPNPLHALESFYETQVPVSSTESRSAPSSPPMFTPTSNTAASASSASGEAAGVTPQLTSAASGSASGSGSGSGSGTASGSGGGGSSAGATPASLDDGTIAVEDLQLLVRPGGSFKVLGRGAFGTVVAGRYKHEPVAVKVVRPSEGHKRAMRALAKEVRVLLSCSHAHVVRFHGLARGLVALRAGEPGNLLLVFELMEGGDLFRALHGTERAKYLWRGARGPGVALDVARGLEYLHAQRYVHCDIKSPNLLLQSADGAVKIGDLGMAKLMLKDLVTKDGTIGSMAWAAPELLQDTHIDEKVDIYSFGVVLWEIITGELPQRGQRRAPRVPEECSAGVASLCRAATHPLAAMRPTAAELVAALEREAAAAGYYAPPLSSLALQAGGAGDEEGEAAAIIAVEEGMEGDAGSEDGDVGAAAL